MNIKITDANKTTGVKKSKKSGKAAQTDGPSFASLLEGATPVDQAEATSSLSSVSGLGGGLYDQLGEEVPKDAKGRSTYMLEKLDELQLDILAGEPTAAIEKLRQALDTEVIDRDELPPQLQELVDEVEARASIEVAKMEASKKA